MEKEKGERERKGDIEKRITSVRTSDINNNLQPHQPTWSKHGQHDGAFFPQRNHAFPIIRLLTKPSEKQRVSKLNHRFLQFMSMTVQKQKDHKRQPNRVQYNLCNAHTKDQQQMTTDVARLFEICHQVHAF